MFAAGAAAGPGYWGAGVVDPLAVVCDMLSTNAVTRIRRNNGVLAKGKSLSLSQNGYEYSKK